MDKHCWDLSVECGTQLGCSGTVVGARARVLDGDL